MAVKNLVELFFWFLKLGVLRQKDDYSMHDYIRAKFCPKYFPEAEFDEKEQVLRDTPGPAGIKYAFFVGGKVGGVPGAALAVLALLAPVFVIAIAFVYLYEPFMGIQMLNIYMGEKIFNGMHAAALGILIAHLYKIIYFNRVKKKALIFIAPAAVVFIFVSDIAGKNNAVLMPFYILAILVFGIISGLVHLWAVAYRKKHPKKFEPYSKKAIKQRDRQLRDEEWDMARFIGEDPLKERKQQVEEERLEKIQNDKINKISDGKE